MSGEHTLGGSDRIQTPGNDSALSIEAAISRLREDWRAGIRIPIAHRLSACAVLCNDPIKAAELIYHDFVIRRERGEAADWQGLLSEFSHYSVELQHFREADDLIESSVAASSVSRFGGYGILEEVGRGGMGVVYRAREDNLDRTVALKRIRGGAFAHSDGVRRFLTEAKAVSRLNHPNIVQIYRVSDCDGELLIALEFVEGPTLAERIGGTPLTPRLAGAVCGTVARAIEYAHQRGVIHRDLKPANILLSGPPERPVPKVTDFGAAKELDQRTGGEQTQFLGTPSYMAPEQIESKWGTVGELTDVYGIGAVLYECLTGRPPFRADSIGETLRQVVETQPVSPRLLNPAVPRDLEIICLRCLQKEPRRRYESAAALAEDLNRFLAGHPIHARPIGPAARAWMWCRRNPRTASLAAVLIIAVLGGMSGITFQWRRAESARKDAQASDLEAQQLVTDLIDSTPADGHRTYRPATSIIEVLQKAEAHCKRLLEKNPSEINARITLTNVYARLAILYGQRGQFAEAHSSASQAQQLWESQAIETGDPVCRYWLAVTYSMQQEGNIREFFRSCEKANAIWLKLAEEQPDDLDLTTKIWAFRKQMMSDIGKKVFRETLLPLFEESRARLEAQVRGNSSDRTLREQLALTCFLLGEVHGQLSSVAKASAEWRESYEHYSILAEGRPDDLLDGMSLAISCSRLIQRRPEDPYYLRAVPLLEKAGAQIKALSGHFSDRPWLRDLLVQNYCCLALCHAEAGQVAKAAQVSNDCLSYIATSPHGERAGSGVAIGEASTLVSFGHRLREARQPDAALRIVRTAAAICSQVAQDPSRDPHSLLELGHALTECSGLANQLGQFELALEQAELARRITDEWMRTAPDDPWREEWLGEAWMRVAKARWGLGRHDDAFAAFRESAALKQRVFQREPSNHSYRERLSQCYDRLVFYGASAGNLRVAADAILERTKLWPDDPAQLGKSADDFNALAAQVTARDPGHLSRKNQAERDHYLAESLRIRAMSKALPSQTRDSLRVER
jgi:tetratricopeptide (TPR) repeat protein